jgi:uncharacterized lipoprotein YmbA
MNNLLPVVFSALFLITGCSSSPAPQTFYYRLNDTARTGRVIVNPAAPALVLERVELAGFLMQSGMVIQQGDNQILVSRQHLWAESLDDALPRALQDALQSATENYRIYLQGTDFISSSDYMLRLHIDNFQATDDSRAVMSGRYQLMDVRSETEITLRNFSYALDFLEDGYPHAVSRLQLLVESLAATIIEDLPLSQDLAAE